MRLKFFRIAVFLALLLPWLNPFAPGPSAAVFPWLVCLAASAFLLLLSVFPVTLRTSLALSFNQRWVLPVAYAWVAAGLISSVFGLLQYLGYATDFSPWINHTSLGEAFANLRQRNQFATLTVLALAALLGLALLRQKPVSRPVQVLFLLAAALLAMGNALSSSRTGLVQMGMLALFAPLVWSGWRAALPRNMLVVAVLSYCLCLAFLPWLVGSDFFSLGLVARLNTVDVVCTSRLTLWSNVLHLIAQKPWLGWGWGELSYAHHSALYAGPRFCDILDNAHNLPLHLAVELGLPIALVLCTAFVVWVWSQKPWRERDAMRQMAWAVLVLILLHSMLEYPLWYGPFQMTAGLCFMFLWRAKKTVKTPMTFSVLPGFTALVLAVSFLYAAWDYHRVSQIYLPSALRDAVYRDDTLAKINRTWLFVGQARFATLMLTPLDVSNAQWIFDTSGLLMHFSPEPRVVERRIESASMLGFVDEAEAQTLRYQNAFPLEFKRWMARHSVQKKPSPDAVND
jgi:O-antigen ligase